MKKGMESVRAAARVGDAKPPNFRGHSRHRPGGLSSPGLHRLNRRNHDRQRPRRRSNPSRAVAAGTAAVMKSDPRAASRACRRTRSASCSACPGDERTASRLKTAVITRLIPSKMSVVGMASTHSRNPCHPATSASARTASAKTRAIDPNAARRLCRASMARSRRISASRASLRRLMLRTTRPPIADGKSDLASN